MTVRRVAAALALALIAFWLWRTHRSAELPAHAPSAHVTSGANPNTAGANVERQRGPPPERSTLADALNSPSTDIRADLKLVSEIIGTFRSNFPQTGNPVGSNAEITAALMGQNRLRLALIPADHPAINRDGELCDRWGTPFFFHAESATRMEVRSAGPDRKMWNDDDVVFSP